MHRRLDQLVKVGGGNKPLLDGAHYRQAAVLWVDGHDLLQKVAVSTSVDLKRKKKKKKVRKDKKRKIKIHRRQSCPV